MPYEEMDGFPEERWTRERGTEIVTQYPLPWADRRTFVPPAKAGLIVASKSIKGVGRLSGVEVEGVIYAVYERALVEVTYIVPPEEEVTPGGIAAGWTFDKSWGMDVIQTGPRMQWRKGSGTSPDEFIEQGCPVLVPMCEWTVTHLEQTTYPAAAFKACMGRINNAIYQGVAKGHMLCLAPGVRGSIGDKAKMDVTFKFLERPYDWRKKFNDKTGTWDWVMTGKAPWTSGEPDGDGLCAYDLADFSALGVTTVPAGQ